ncbi:hypothetical protein B566_EDAN013837 [Ephemera danica]|nr:hypothetical protein B566_EDAN013837 [Ephemera danica]
MWKDRLTKPPSDKDVMYVYWDSECTSDTPVSNDESDGYYHRKNLIYAQTTACRCEDSELDEQGPLYEFIDDPLKELMDFLCIMSNQFKKIICIAHNTSSYNSHFILKYVLTTMTGKPKIILRGYQILCLEVNKRKFIYYIDYFPMALKNISASFDMPANDNTSVTFSTLLKIYLKMLFLMFVFMRLQEKKINAYILTQACRRFKSLIVGTGNVKLFTECITLVVCYASLILRRNFLANNVVGNLPTKIYRFAENQSQIAIKWLNSTEHKNDIVVRQAGRNKRVRLPTERPL